MRSRAFRRVFHDVYVAARTPDSVHLRADAASLLLPPEAAFCGLTAARLYGLTVPERDMRTHVAVPSSAATFPRSKDPRVHRYTIPADQITVHEGRRLVGPARLFLELAATLPRLDLLVAGDEILRRGLAERETIAAFLAGSHRRRGVQRARDALPLLDARADSPPETRLRILLTDHGLPRPMVNEDVLNGWGVWLARPDLSYPALKIAIQYEGRHHQQDPQQYAYDIERDARLIDAGWIVIRVDADALFRHPRHVVRRVRNALAQRRP
ncbi:very short patch repair endonuclease [Actinomadura parmotrematis]|uniref:Very short patch repair endonuclease n=1 Tax=Actinomadura parmotrematis TaxID=2864039 RepID=A0ABS7FRN0_9ACTN|nr:very short patch repair endonuclease [Actinomadura parmotrematis]MBW8483059.1 very short patch repair endonuclease [Actinomadura parmotrematis]